jgi:long-chain acyl-CoA synthetase
VASVSGVRDVAVVGLRQGRDERVHAVVVLEPGTSPGDIVREANTRLLDHQKVRGVSVWPGAELPRTEGTRKLKRREIAAWVETGSPPTSAGPGQSVQAVLAQYAAGRTVGPGTTIDELGLSSLERVELMVALEDRFQTTIDEAAFSGVKSVAELESLVRAPAAVVEGGDAVDFPRWNRAWPVRLLRRASLATWILPLARVFARIRVEGYAHVERLDGPVVFASNHQSHLDTPVILAALRGHVRAGVAVAMAKEFFKAHFFPAEHTRVQRFTNSLNYYLAATFFNAFPLPQREVGARDTLRYIGELLGDGFSVLIFPEGKRTEHGEINAFRPGIGMIGARLGVPIVPVRLVGADQVLHQKARMASRGRVTVKFGAPVVLRGDDYAALARQVEDAVRAL